MPFVGKRTMDAVLAGLGTMGQTATPVPGMGAGILPPGQPGGPPGGIMGGEPGGMMGGGPGSTLDMTSLLAMYGAPTLGGQINAASGSGQGSAGWLGGIVNGLRNNPLTTASNTAQGVLDRGGSGLGSSFNPLGQDPYTMLTRNPSNLGLGGPGFDQSFGGSGLANWNVSSPSGSGGSGGGGGSSRGLLEIIKMMFK